MGTKTSYLKKAILLVLVVFTLANSECDFDFSPRDPCANSNDPTHCYIDVAIERADPSFCEKIEAPPQFTKSNPPKDKCFMSVAQATGDPSHCLSMVGGEGSYERNDCIMVVAVEERSFEACELLRGNPRNECYEKVGENVKTNDLLNNLDEIEILEQQLRSDWRNEALKKELEDLKRKQDLMYANAPPDIQREYYRMQREKIFDSIEDPELRRMVSRDFIAYRSKNQDASVTELFERMQEIREEKETIQRLDREAQRLIDDMKENIIAFGSDQAMSATEELTGAAWEWTVERAKRDMDWDLSRLERMKEQYDKASAQYQAITERIEQFQQIYEDVTEVYEKVNKFNRMAANGEIEEGHAEVLKGAVFLGKGLEYATAYVPVFGSTASTISKETFDATVKFATRRAKRTTALNKCIEDPLNCDLDGITAY